MNIFKIIFYLLAYGLTITIGSNFVLGYNSQKRDPNDDFIFKTLNSVSYFQYDFDPYKAAQNLEVHPTNYFSLPLNSKAKKSINNLLGILNNLVSLAII